MDGREISGTAAQVFTPNGSSIIAATSHDVTNVGVWISDVDNTFKYDLTAFNSFITIKAGQPIGVPRNATTLTLGTSSNIATQSD